MRTRRFLWLLPISLLAVTLVSHAQQAAGTKSPATSRVGAATAAPCDRHCLLQFLTDYTEALTDNDPSHLALATGVKVTNNGEVTTLGKGDVWGPARRLPYRHAFVDPMTGSAIFYGVVTNATQTTRPDAPSSPGSQRWWYWTLRLKIENRKISEVEEIAYERAANAFGAEASTMTLGDRIFDTVLPQSERSTRQQLFDMANMYFDAVSHRIDYHKVPWHPECQRIELGVFTVNTTRSPGSCGGEFQTPSVKWLVENRRFYIADVERGVVIASGNFTAPPDFPKNNPSVVMEAFKVQDGMIRHIFAFFRGNGQPKSGWPDVAR